MAVLIAIGLLVVVGLPVALALWYWSNPSHTFLWSKGRPDETDYDALYRKGLADGYAERFGQPPPPGYGQPPYPPRD